MDKAEREIKSKEGIICSMTFKGRKNCPDQGHAQSVLPTAPACRCRKSTACSRVRARCRPWATKKFQAAVFDEDDEEDMGGMKAMKGMMGGGGMPKLPF